MFNKIIVLMFVVLTTGSCFQAYKVIASVAPTLQAYDAQIAREANVRKLASQ